MIAFPGEFIKSSFAEGYKYDLEKSESSLADWNERWQRWLKSANFQGFIWHNRHVGEWDKPCDDEWIDSYNKRGAKP